MKIPRTTFRLLGFSEHKQVENLTDNKIIKEIISNRVGFAFQSLKDSSYPRANDYRLTLEKLLVTGISQHWFIISPGFLF